MITTAGLFAYPTNAALTATTANTIQGSQPYFLLSDGSPLLNTDQLLGFSYPDTSVPGGIKYVTRTGLAQTLLIPDYVKENELIPLMLPDNSDSFRSLNNLITNGNLSVTDVDGDASIVANTSALGHMRVTLFKDDSPITPVNSTLSACANYRLELEIDTSTGADKVTAHTKFGVPNQKEYSGNTRVTYTLLSQANGLCYIKTGDMTVHSGKPTGKSSYPGTGYNSAFWEYDTVSATHKGFNVANLRSASPVRAFPTSGFENAVLKFIGSGNDQSKYRCKSNSSAITLSGAASTALGQNCQMTYKAAKPTSPVTIILEYNTSGSNWQQVDSYTIPVPILWAQGGAFKQYNTRGQNYKDPLAYTGDYRAANYCEELLSGVPGTLKGLSDYAKAASYLFKRSEITNAPQAYTDYVTYDNTSLSWKTITLPYGTASSWGGFFSRDADGSFMGEWGNVLNYGPTSPWLVGNEFGWGWWMADGPVWFTQHRMHGDGLSNFDDPYPHQLFSVLCKG